MRRTGKPVADLIDEDDEIFIGIERSARPKIGEFQNFAAARIPSRKKDRIVLLFRKLAEGGIGELKVSDLTALLKLEITEIVGFERAVDLLGIEIGSHNLPRRMSGIGSIPALNSISP